MRGRQKVARANAPIQLLPEGNYILVGFMTDIIRMYYKGLLVYFSFEEDTCLSPCKNEATNFLFTAQIVIRKKGFFQQLYLKKMCDKPKSECGHWNDSQAEQRQQKAKNGELLPNSNTWSMVGFLLNRRLNKNLTSWLKESAGAHICLLAIEGVKQLLTNCDEKKHTSLEHVV